MARVGGGNENAGHLGARGRRYFPFEYTALALLEHIVTEEDSGPFTSYGLRKVKSVRGQRLDRFTLAIEILIERGWVEPLPGKNTRYRATDWGKKEYLSWGCRTLEFVRSTRVKRGHGELTSSYRVVRLRDSATGRVIALGDFG